MAKLRAEKERNFNFRYFKLLTERETTRIFPFFFSFGFLYVKFWKIYLKFYGFEIIIILKFVFVYF